MSSVYLQLSEHKNSVQVRNRRNLIIFAFFDNDQSSFGSNANTGWFQYFCMTNFSSKSSIGIKNLDHVNKELREQALT